MVGSAVEHHIYLAQWTQFRRLNRLGIIAFLVTLLAFGSLAWLAPHLPPALDQRLGPGLIVC
jgi:hypothetical protein